MSKSNRRKAPANTPRPKPKANASPYNPSRRASLKHLRNGTIAVFGLGAGGWYIASEVSAGIQESDLTRIGNGKPTIVQIHDPGCPTCRSLQQAVRRALDRIDDPQLQYLVANIRQNKGKQLARQHGVQHVTLLLLDGDGSRRDVLTGLQTPSFLEQAFRRHLHAWRQPG